MSGVWKIFLGVWHPQETQSNPFWWKTFVWITWEKYFLQSGNMKNPLKTHIREKPYKCLKCGNNFSEYCSLKKHKAYYAGEKLYECFTCPNFFNLSGNLKQHMKIHTGLKSYECLDRDKSFVRSSQVQQNKFTNSGDKSSVCFSLWEILQSFSKF